MRTHQIATPDGATLAAQELGPTSASDAPALLLLQGQANSHRWWLRLRDELAAEHRTITFDYRGTGGSSGVGVGDDRWSTASFADDAALVLDALDVESAFVFGTSMGGRVAQRLTASHPERVCALALACTSPGGRLATERSDDVRRALASPHDERRYQAIVDLFYTPAGAAEFGPGSPLFGDRRMSRANAAAHLRVSAGHDGSQLLAAIDVPTLVLHGEDDRMVPPVNARVIADAIPGARLALVPEGRHGFFEEFAWVVTPTVLDFFAG